ncbi:MAG: biopolymer transporter ExbB [Paracoccaceae bacterium]
MATPDTQASPQFSWPAPQVIQILIVLGLTGFGATIALPSVLPVFQANPYLNIFIAFVFCIGVLSCFWQVVQVIYSVGWLRRFTLEDENAGKAPQLLAPLATMLRSRGAQMQINSSSSRSILDSVATRIDEVRDITRYIVNTLIFLGLLGTFYGLATTVPAVVDTIRSLAPQDGEGGVEVFNRLMTGLEAQLGGMGVAFASSLLGLAGSLVVGLLELFVGHSQNRFYRELEEWLSSITRMGYAAGDDTGGSETGAMVGVLLHMAEQMESLQQMFAESDLNRSVTDDKLDKLANAFDGLAAKLDNAADTGASDAMYRVAAGQERLLEMLERQGADGMDPESRMRLRSIDVQMLRILEEMSAGRQESVTELRKELARLTDAMSPEMSIGRRLRGKATPSED